MSALNAATFDGVSKVFDWSGQTATQDGLATPPYVLDLLKAQSAPGLDILSQLTTEAKNLVNCLARTASLIQSVRALGLSDPANMLPFPLPGTLAYLKLNDLMQALKVEAILQSILQSPMDINQGAQGTTPLNVVPGVIIRRIAG